MAYDRYENRGGWRDEDRRERGHRGRQDERGFFERARDEVSSWFSDEEDPARGRRYGETRYDPDYEPSGSRHDRERFGRNEDRGAFFGGGQSSSYGRGREGGDYRNQYGRGSGESGGFGSGRYDRQDRDYPNRIGQSGSRRREEFGRSDYGRGSGWFGRDRDEDDYRPMAGDYSRSGQEGYRSGMGGQDFSRSQYGRQEFSQDQDRDRGFGGGRTYNYGGWGDQESQRPTFGAAASGFGGGRHDEHYSSWRQRQIDELDRDYDEYRREHQSRFENEFSGWRTQRQTKRQMLQQIREHNEVVDQNGEHVGTVDKVRGDKVILTKSDPESGGVHRSFTCSLLDRVEDGKVHLSGTKDSIRNQLQEERGEGRERGALFGSSDEDRRERGEGSQGEEGPHILDRSFSGTYEESSGGTGRRKK